MTAFVETDRMVLRRFVVEDLEALVGLDNDPEVMHFINNGAAVEQRDVANSLEHWIRSYETSDGFGIWAAELKPTGSFVGWFHLRVRESEADPELGYRLHRWAWGRELATEGSRALIDKAFNELGAERVTAETMAVHVASRRVMEKAGMRYVRTFRSTWPVRIPGDDQGDVEYEITRSQWSEARLDEQS